MSLKLENQTSRSPETVFYGAMNTNGDSINIGQIIDLSLASKVGLAGKTGNTANGVVNYATVVKSLDFYITVTAYSSGTFVPILEGLKYEDFTPVNPAPIVTSISAAQAATKFATVTDPYTDTQFAVNDKHLVLYSYANDPANTPQTGSFDFIQDNKLSAVSTAISRSDAVNLGSSVNNKKVFRFGFVPGLATNVGVYSFLRFSMQANDVAGGAGATVLVQVVKTYEGIF